MGPLYLLVALLCSCSTAAIPIPPPLVSVMSGPSPVAVVLGVCAPFVLLAVVKYAYMKYRRAESIHSEVAHAEAEVKFSPPLVGLGLEPKVLKKGSRKLDLSCLSGYAVGMLGSPEWETRVKVRIDKALRKACSEGSEAASRAASPSTATRSRFGSSHRSHDVSVAGHRSSRHASSTSSKSRAMSLSFLEMYSPDSNVGNCAAIHPNSPPCSASHPRLPAYSESVRSKSNSSSSRIEISTSSLSPTLMQMMEPVVASWQDDIPKQETSRSTGSTGRNGSHSPTPPFETPPSTPAKSSASLLDSLSRTSRSAAADVSQPVISMTSAAFSTSVQNGSLLTVPTSNKRSAAGQIQQTSIVPISTPLSPTTRPLNISVPRIASKASIDYLSASPAQYVVERLVAPRPKAQRRKSGSPSIGPSPLRNPVTSSSSSSLSNSDGYFSMSKTEASHTSPAASVPHSPHWDLDDLMKNGKLDIDAVTEALGLGFSLSDSSTSGPSSGSDSRSPANTTSLSESLLRKPGGPLCAIPEEADVEDSVIDESLRPLSSLIERWGRVQHFQHQRFTVDTGDVRESVSSSVLEVDLSLLGIDVSAISGIGTPSPGSIARGGSSDRDSGYTWEAEDTESVSGWRDDLYVSDGVGLAC
ncbi:hypothetical protein BC835DRAFT_307908 [Cytidiella melzeri]|nr:hypothetical protein BC835DRAFT_307908 [Cytidiella melzeri]